MEQRRISELISELDSLVSKDGAKVIFSQYGGGPDESEISANTAGYLRLGIEFLKAAIVQPQDERQPTRIEINLEGLVSEGSDINFDCFYRHPQVAEKAIPSPRWKDRLFLALGLGFILSILGLALCGFIWLLAVIF